jgi:hypothetical protein
MAAMRARQDDAGLQPTTLAPRRAGQRVGVLIVGARRGEVFVATEVLISAETLGDEEAIRAWLAQHDIGVAPPCRDAAPASKGSAQVPGSSGTPGRTWTADD